MKHPALISLLALCALLPACRGLGLGKQLLEAMEHHVRRGGGRLVRLEAGTAQTEALELYERAGYQRCGAFAGYPDNPYSTFYRKDLTAAPAAA